MLPPRPSVRGGRLTGGLQGVKAGVVEYGDLFKVVEVRQVGEVIEVGKGVVGECQDDEAGGEVLVAAVQCTDAVTVQEQFLEGHTPHVIFFETITIY